MNSHKWMQTVAMLVTMVIVLLNFCGITLAGNEEVSAGNTVGESSQIPLEGSGDEASMSSRDIQYGSPIPCRLTRAVTPMYAPYDSGSAPFNITLPVNRGVYVLSRDYECFYMLWYDENNKEVYGYIPNDAVNLTECGWTQYDIYRKGICTSSTQVLSGAGTLNTYVLVDTIDASSDFLMILGQRRNVYNNKLYYFVQWETSEGLAKRGWVDSTLNTVRIDTSESDSLMDDPDSWFVFRERNTGFAFSYRFDEEGHHLEVRPYDAGIDQMFRLERATTNGQFMGFYRIIPYNTPTVALTVSSNGYNDNLELIWESKGEVDKKQEFYIGVIVPNGVGDGNELESVLATRSTGTHREVAFSTRSVVTTKLIQSSSDTAFNDWEIIRIPPAFVYTYGQNTSAFPRNFKLYVDSSVTSMYPVSRVQECLDEWNDIYPFLNLTAEVMSANSNFDGSLGYVVCNNLFSRDVPVGFTESYGRKEEGIVQYSVISLNLNFIESQVGNNITDQKKVLIHEIGHALMLTHTHQSIKYSQSNDSYEWQDSTKGLTVMDQGFHSYWRPTVMDLYRLRVKWDPVRIGGV